MSRVGDNAALTTRIQELGLSQAEVVRRMNAAAQILTGRYGTYSERTFYKLIVGKTRWPHERTRRVLEEVLGRSATELGFHPPARPHHPESPVPVQRRVFLAGTASAATAAAVPTLASRHQIGDEDVARMRAKLDSLTSLDQSRGGHNALETAAITGADNALDMGKGSASQRVHRELLALAADFTATAAFSALDNHRLNEAERYLNTASSLAAVSQDRPVEIRVLVSTTMLHHHRGNRPAAIAAAEAAMWKAAHRDPFYSSLTHARLAVAHADAADRQAALRSLGNATEHLGRIDGEAERPSWTAFWGAAELRTLTAVTHQLLGEPELAEAANHQALSMIPSEFRRNRALATARLALAQLDQREVDQACHSAHRVLDLMGTDPLPGRTRTVLGDFHRLLLTTAPQAPATIEWTERARREWSRAS